MPALGLTDGSAGMISQVRALAEAMGVELELVTISVNKIWHYLPNRAYDLGLATIFPVTGQYLPSSPKLVISCGRKSALVAASLPNTKRIHIQDPQMSPKHFDAVIAMKHDKLKGSNVISVPYALTSITEGKLAAARSEWMGKFGHLRKPWSVVLIGGSTNKYRFTSSALEKLMEEVEQISGALLVTTSRRTGEENIKKLMARWGGSNRIYLYTGKGENPYLGMLAAADHVYVTNDSVNMMSEAVASGKPVSILKLHGHKRTKPARFATKLCENTMTPREMMERLAVSIRQMLA